MNECAVNHPEVPESRRPPPFNENLSLSVFLGLDDINPDDLSFSWTLKSTRTSVTVCFCFDEINVTPFGNICPWKPTLWPFVVCWPLQPSPPHIASCLLFISRSKRFSCGPTRRALPVLTTGSTRWLSEVQKAEHGCKWTGLISQLSVCGALLETAGRDVDGYDTVWLLLTAAWWILLLIPN